MTSGLTCPAQSHADDQFDFADFDQANFIVGGVTVAPSDPVASSTVALQSTTPMGVALCTASLVSDDLAITAAHCVTEDDGRVSAPSTLKLIFGRDIRTATATAAVVGAIVPSTWHGGSTNGVDQGDIALVRFRGPIPAGYRAATLLDANQELQRGDRVTLAGYGITNGVTHEGSGILRKASNIAVVNPNMGRTEVELDQRGGHGACHGDSGGPAFVQGANGALYLWGVTNRGYPPNAPDDCKQYVIYTKINAYRPWLRQAADYLHRLR